MKKKIITALTTTAIACSAFAFPFSEVKASAATYNSSDLFVVTDAEFTTGTENGATYFAVDFADDSKAEYKQSMALEWMESASEKGYFSLELGFADFSFDSFTVAIESEQKSITSDNKTTNEITFTKSGVSVNGGEEVAMSFSDVKISLAEGTESGSYEVIVNGVEVGTFENIGRKYAKYVSSSSDTPIVPLTLASEGSGTVLVKSLNGQSFSLTDGKITDNAAPVFVVNEEVRSFLLGYTVDFDYVVLDVCDETTEKTLSCLQYGKDEATTLTSSTIIFETDVYDTYQAEFLNVTAKVSDESGNEKEFDLAWYARPSDVKNFDGKDYFSVVRNQVGARYVGTQAQYERYQEAIEKAADGVTVGSSSYVNFPSMKDLIEDDDTAYEDFKFTIYYKTETGSSVSSATSLTSSGLRLAASSAGKYAVKVVVTDKMGNAMIADEDGKEVEVTASNVFDLDSIPVFTYTVYNYGVSVENVTTVKTGYIDATISASAFTINAVSGYDAVYKLYYFDNVAYHEATGEYIGSKQLSADPAAYKDYFDEIDPYNSAIKEEDEAWSSTDNAYEWSTSSRSFVPQKTGFYIVEVEVIDAELYGVSAYAYQTIQIIAEQDIIKGETTWVQDNIASIVLLSVAAVALIGIVVVIVIDPKEKDLDEID
ncbi:MAG: hypothetical protein J6D37_05365 [Clostridia bacterium]|nr:hypothetical protein [Clostridia bacterium]